ncbi:13963_t:CDS:2, partial [Acaulospora colombiana]
MVLQKSLLSPVLHDMERLTKRDYSTRKRDILVAQRNLNRAGRPRLSLYSGATQVGASKHSDKGIIVFSTPMSPSAVFLDRLFYTAAKL